MISVVFCSITDAKARFTERHYRELLKGQAHEIITIRDARSLAEAYNRGIDQAQGDIVIFSHDDIEFLDIKTWYARLCAHLETADVVGVAGTRRLIGASWAQAGPPYNFGQIAENDGKKTKYHVLIFGASSAHVARIQALDGLFFVVKRSVLEKVRFDEKTFDGFHGYDVDFTFSAHLAGFKLAVATDLPILHASGGNFDDKFRHYADLLMAKHKSKFNAMPQRSWQVAVVWANSKQEILDIVGHGDGTANVPSTTESKDFKSPFSALRNALSG